MPNVEQEVGNWDSVLLENPTEDNFISNLHQRYKRDHIYTYIGTYLVSINPFKPLPLTTPELVKTYATRGVFKLPPHIFGVASGAYANLFDFNEDQSIVLLGESGSGKSETAQMAVDFLTRVPQIRRNHLQPNKKGSNTSLSCSGPGSSNASRSSTPKHEAPLDSPGGWSFGKGFISRQRSVESEKSGYGSLRKCSQDRLVDSYWKSSDNLPTKCQGHMHSTPKIGKKCPKHASGDSQQNKNVVFSRTLYDDCAAFKRSCSLHRKDAGIQDKLDGLTKNYGFMAASRLAKCSMDCDRVPSRRAKTPPPHFGRGSGGYANISSIVENFRRIMRSRMTSEEVELQRYRERIAHAEIFISAMGSAKTAKNRNSSRFGKFYDIEFDFKGDVIGGRIYHYMLEKTRITNVAGNERNFNIFYQLLAGADIQLLKALKLQRNIEKYEILKNSLATEEDRQSFSRTRRSLDIMGLSIDEISSIFRILSVVLKLGNLVFLPTTNIDGTEGCTIANEYEIVEIAQLLEIHVDVLILCLTRISPNWSQIPDSWVEVDAEVATKMKLTLCRTLYGRLFVWLVARMNDEIKSTKLNGHKRFLGILDFSGFEVLERNSLEQLSINYCSERLQQHFLSSVLKEQQELYIREGLEWTKVDFFDNSGICDLFDRANYGILSLLDEPHVACDEIYLTRMHQCSDGHPNFLSEDLTNGSSSFQIRHYAGTVSYSVTDFVEKNSEQLPRSVSYGLYQSSLHIVQHLFPEGNPKRSSKRPTSFASNLRVSVHTLLKTLARRKCHYVFCLKPNDFEEPRHFEMSLVQHQVRYFSLMQVLNVWRNGFCFSMSHVAFLARYKLLNDLTWPHFTRGSIVEAIALIVRSLPLPTAEFTISTQRVFIRSPRTVFEMEEFRRMRLGELATLIQKTFRGFHDRSRYTKAKESQIKIARLWRSWRSKEDYRVLKYRRRVQWAVEVIQKHYIVWKRRHFLLLLPHRLPLDSMSPLCSEWPRVPHFLAETSQLLRKIYHRWRCHKYRKLFDQTARNRMREKVTASIIFRDRKACYMKSIGRPFIGDYVRLRQNVQWKRISMETNDQYVVFADIINKITRTSGKFVPILLVLSTSSMLLLDQKTLQVKYRIPATEIYRLSLSPYPDDIAVFHITPYQENSRCHHQTLYNQQQPTESPTGCLFQSEMSRQKGDFAFQTCHVIEIVTKLFLVIQNATAKPPEVHISTEFEANFNQQTVIFTFKCGRVPETTPKVSRKGNRMEIII
ncbi:unconventional myosin-Ib [Sergentomyia squamirostris]